MHILLRSRYFRTGIKQHSTIPLEYSLAGIAALWGLHVAMPWTNAFAAVPQGFRFMLYLMPEAGWGLLFLLYGCAHLWALHPPVNKRRCQQANALGSVLYGMIAFNFLIGVVSSTATPVYVGLSVASYWCHLRLAYVA